MVTALEIPSIRRQAVPISLATYHGMAKHGLVAENVELIRGVIVEKMPRSSLHVILTDELRERLSGLLPGFWVRSEAPLTLLDSEPEPDISVVTGDRWSYLAGHPTTAILVVEVAVTSAEIDREKASVYAEAGVAEYWIILAQEGAVEVYTNAEGSQWRDVRRFKAGEDIRSIALPQVVIPHATLFRPAA